MANSRLSDQDLDFVIQEAVPEFSDKAKLRQLIREDEAFRKALLGDDRVFRKVMADDEVILRISPALYFEVLLRRTLKELEKAGHTIERTATQAIPVFDVKRVVDLLAKQVVLDYLADMLSSLTRINSYVIPVRVRKGIWRKIRFNDMDVDSLSRLCETASEEERFSLYKRIGDVCLFILGIFPEYVQDDYRYPSSGEKRPKLPMRLKRSLEDYEEEGVKFYKLAAQHPSARILGLSEVLWLLHENLATAKKPLNFISEHYLHYKKRQLFDI